MVARYGEMRWYTATWYHFAAPSQYASLKHVASIFNLISPKGIHCAACHIIVESETAGWILSAIFFFFFGSAPVQHVRWARSAVVWYLPLKDIRGFVATLAARVGTLWHFVTQTGSHKKKNIPFVARCISSWHRQRERRGFVFCVVPAWIFAWIYSKDQQASRIGGSKLANGVNLCQSVFDPCDRLTTFAGYSYFLPKMHAGIRSSPLWHRKWALV